MSQHPNASNLEAPYPVTIEKLVYGGDGLGRLPSGEVVFVPWSVPGDHLLVQRMPGKQKPAKGQLVEIIQPSSERIKPQCSVFGLCGGCQWQEISPTAQREWKRRIVEESLSRLGKITNVTVSELLGSDDAQWHFRNRVQWDVQWNDSLQRFELGYCKADSHEVIAFEMCWIIPTELSRLANWLQTYFQQNPESASGLKRIEVMQNADGQILLSGYGEMDGALCSAVTHAFPDILGVVAFHPKQKFSTPQLLFGQNFINETILGKQYQVSAGNFFQTNRHATELILDILDQWLIPQAESLLDLYSGVGLFALHFQNRAKRITAIESAPSTIEDAKENAKRHGISHIQWASGNAEKTLQSLKENFEVAILDPPRAGCQPEVLNWLSQHVTRQMLYVSCNPTTLARDLKILTEAGWTIQAVQPVDMFPQTYHVETVVHLMR